MNPPVTAPNSEREHPSNVLADVIHRAKSLPQEVLSRLRDYCIQNVLAMEQFAGLSQSHFLSQLLEQFDSEAFSQLTYAHRNTRLAQMNVLGRSGKIQSRAHGEKNLKGTNIHWSQNSKQLLLSLDQFISSKGATYAIEETLSTRHINLGTR